MIDYLDLRDAATIRALADANTRVYTDLILPSGRVMSADDLNRLIQAGLPTVGGNVR